MTIKGYKKKYFICKDDNGKMIYAGDTVEVNLPWETGTSYQSIVYWDRLHGALIEPHPGHKKMGHENYRRLSDFLGKQEHKCWLYTEDDEDDKFEIKYTKCIKVKSFYQD